MVVEALGRPNYKDLLTEKLSVFQSIVSELTVVEGVLVGEARIELPSELRQKACGTSRRIDDSR